MMKDHHLNSYFKARSPNATDKEFALGYKIWKLILLSGIKPYFFHEEAVSIAREILRSKK